MKKFRIIYVIICFCILLSGCNIAPEDFVSVLNGKSLATTTIETSETAEPKYTQSIEVSSEVTTTLSQTPSETLTLDTPVYSETALPTISATVTTTPTLSIKPTPTYVPTPKPTATPKPVNSLVSRYGQSAYDKAKKVNSSILNSKMNNLEKTKAIHDYIVDNVRYDTTYSRYSAYDALIVGSCVCQGYAEAFQLMMELAGLPCKFVTGRANSGSGWISHAWNAVQMDGVWYYVDTTWDDPVVIGGGDVREYEYFMIPYNLISMDHITDVRLNNGTSTKYRDWAMQLQFDAEMKSDKEDAENNGFLTVEIDAIEDLDEKMDLILNESKVCIYCPYELKNDVTNKINGADLFKYNISSLSMSGYQIADAYVWRINIGHYEIISGGF